MQKVLSISSEGARRRRRRAGIANPENNAERGTEVDASHAEVVDVVPC